MIEEEETQSMAEVQPEAPPEPEGEKVLCAVSKKMVLLEDTVEIERHKGETLRIHKRFKRFE